MNEVATNTLFKEALVVDDASEIRNMLELILEQAGIGSIQTSNDGVSGLCQSRFVGEESVVISDQNMPGMTGTQMFSQMKKPQGFSERILFSAGLDTPGDKESVELFRNGMITLIANKAKSDEVAQLIKIGQVKIMDRITAIRDMRTKMMRNVFSNHPFYMSPGDANNIISEYFSHIPTHMGYARSLLKEDC